MFVVTVLVPFVTEMVVPLLPPLEALIFSSFVSRMTTENDRGKFNCSKVACVVLIGAGWQSCRRDAELNHWRWLFVVPCAVPAKKRN